MLRAPRQLPPFSLLVADLQAKPREIAKHFGVTERTFWAWKKADRAPRPVMLALFWESRWGRSLADTTAFNEASMYRAQVQGLEREIHRLSNLVYRLDKLADTANSPVFKQA